MTPPNSNDPPSRNLPAAVSSNDAELERAGDRFQKDLDAAAQFFEESLAKSTRRAYANAWARFQEYCSSRGRRALPADPETIAGYLSHVAPEYADQTLRQHMAAVRHVHRRRFPEEVPPTKSALVENVLAGIVRSEHRRPTGGADKNNKDPESGNNAKSKKRPRGADKAEPLRTRHLKKILQVLPGRGAAPSRQDSPSEYATWLRGLRDRALLLTGFAGALRRSEIAALRLEDVAFRLEGCLIYIGRSKTDQEGAGEEVAIASGEHAATCPTQALRRWLSASEIDAGPVFRGVRRSGYLRTGPLTGRSVSSVVKKAAEAAGITPGRIPGSKKRRRFSGHSLRAGHITEATARGADDHLVMQQSRHKDRKTFDGYVRPERLLEHSSSRHLGL